MRILVEHLFGSPECLHLVIVGDDPESQRKTKWYEQEKSSIVDFNMYVLRYYNDSFKSTFSDLK